MRTLELELPDRLADEVEHLVDKGWFVSTAELARHAVTELVHHHRRFELGEQFQREDIRWALSLKKR